MLHHHDVQKAIIIMSTLTADYEALIIAACLRTPPLWQLTDMVAVNPFLGYADGDLLAAEAALQTRNHAAVLPDWAVLRDAWQRGECTAADLADATAEFSAANQIQSDTFLATALHAVQGPPPQPLNIPRCRSIAAVRTAAGNVDWQASVIEDLGRFLAAHTDHGVARWRLGGSENLLSAWREWIAHDRSMAVRGMHGLAAYVAGLPSEAATIRAALLADLSLEPAALETYCLRLLSEIQGWAGRLRQQAWQTSHQAVGELPDLLTIRLIYDAACAHLLPSPKVGPDIPAALASDELVRDRQLRHVILLAWESAWRRSVVARLADPGAGSQRPQVQAIFCIDVRSEPLRRHVEAQGNGIATYGFAGFFAMPVALTGAVQQAQCPVLLSPGWQVAIAAPPARGLPHLLGAFRRSAVGGFAYMETLGLTKVVSLISGTLGLDRTPPRAQEEADLNLEHISRADRLTLLRGMLTNLGLSQPYARMVVLVGHDSTCANNPQAAGLACGACGGHSGASNARLAARLFNDPELRQHLATEGGAYAIPADSVAVAAVHDTATDVVRILDRDLIPSSHATDLAEFERGTAAAGSVLRTERAPHLPGLDHSGGAPGLWRRLFARSRHWAELRPEWGLADNAAFIAAPRAMTTGSNLGGRIFLHSYDAQADPTGAVLNLILTAPVVVASWINLQYYASTVDPQRFGSGNKTVHTVVGGLGVAAGGEGDLLIGLAFQSVHDGQRARHRPLRLQVFVAAERANIDKIIVGHAHLCDLVEHQWIGMHAISADAATCWRRRPGGHWEEMARP